MSLNPIKDRDTSTAALPETLQLEELFATALPEIPGEARPMSAERTRTAIPSVVGHSIIHNMTDAINSLVAASDGFKQEKKSLPRLESLYQPLSYQTDSNWWHMMPGDKIDAYVATIAKELGALQAMRGPNPSLGEAVMHFRELEQTSRMLKVGLTIGVSSSPKVKELLDAFSPALDKINEIAAAQVDYINARVSRPREVSIAEFIQKTVDLKTEGPNEYPLGILQAGFIDPSIGKVKIQQTLVMRAIHEAAKNSVERALELEAEARGITPSDARARREELLKGYKVEVSVVRCDGDPSKFMIMITDNCYGMKNSNLLPGLERQRQHLFDPESSTKGSGIGTTELWHIAKIHGGDASVINVRYRDNDGVRCRGAQINMILPFEPTAPSYEGSA